MERKVLKAGCLLACAALMLALFSACSAPASDESSGINGIVAGSIPLGGEQEGQSTDDVHLLDMSDRLKDTTIPYIVHSPDGFGGIGEGKRVQVDQELLQSIADTITQAKFHTDDSTQFNTLPGTIEVYGGDLYLSVQKLGSSDGSSDQSGTLLNLQMDNNTSGKEGFYANYTVDDESVFDSLLDAARQRFVEDTVEIVSGEYVALELPAGYSVVGLVQGNENLVAVACKDTGADTQSRNYCLYYLDGDTGAVTDTVEVGDGTYTIEPCTYKQYDFRLQSYGEANFQYYSTQDPKDTYILDLPEKLRTLVLNETTGTVGFDADAESNTFTAAGTTTLMASAGGSTTTIDISEVPTEQIPGLDKEKATVVFSSAVLVGGGKYVLAGFYLPNGLTGADEPFSPGYLLYNTESGEKHWLIHTFAMINADLAFPNPDEIIGWKWQEEGEEPGLARLDLNTLEVTAFPAALPKDYTLDDKNINYEYWADYTSENLGDGSADITISTWHGDLPPKGIIRFHGSAADKQVWVQGLTENHIVIGLNDGAQPISRTILVQY